MKVLIATGSFKDVYTSIESCKQFENILREKYETITAPLCDGGEYTYDILKYYYNDMKEIIVNDVVNPYGKMTTSKYAVIDDEAYVVSSEILHLSENEDVYKNPLELTDYGLGQLLNHAVESGYKKIKLCLGGTSTVGYGMGVAQALGAKFITDDGVITKYITPKDFPHIKEIVWNKEKYGEICLTVVNDGITRANNLNTVNPLKIGKHYRLQKEEILDNLSKYVKNIYYVTGLSEDAPYSGNGGGVYYGVEKLFSTEYVKGAEFFCNLFNLEEKINWADIVITGEGRYDNPHLKKLPITVSELAKEHNKKVVFLCGTKDVESEKSAFIDVLLSCDEYYKMNDVRSNYSDDIEMYRELTPIILGQELEKALK